MAVDSLGQLTVDLVANTGGFEAGMDRAQRALKSATKEAAYQAGQLDKLVGQIDPVVGAYGRLDKMEEQLRAHRKAGRLAAEDFDTYVKKLNDQRAALVQTDSALQKNAMSTKAYSAALRNVPPQLTDIFVSLQAGQAPLTVFLQQGGQLKDMFGGIGPAAKALGGYVVGLVNPLTITAAAVAALALAYKQGSDEATAYSTALVSTGNFAGTSAGSLGELARNVAGVTGTVGAAAEVLAQLAGTGKIAVGSFDMIAVAALKTQSATGKAASDIVADFVKIADDPLKAIIKLNEGMNFLTEGVYSQIKAYTDAGDAQAAAALANETYATALETSADKIKENLGYIESAWNIAKNAAKGAWDAFLDVGRQNSLEEQLALVRTNLDEISRLREAGRSGRAARGGGNEQALQAQLTDLLIQKEEKNRRESSARIAAQEKADALDAAQYIDKVHEGFASNAEKRAKERLQYEREIAALQAGVKSGKVAADDPRLNAERIAKDLDNIDQKYADKKVARAKAYVEDAGTKELDQAKQQYAVLQQQSQQLDDQTGKLKALGPAQQELIKWEQELADIKEKKTLTAAQKSLLATADQITAQKTVNAELEKDTQARKESAEQQKQLNEFTQAQADVLSRFQQGLDNQVIGIGLGAEGRKRLQDDLALQNDYANQVERLRRDKIGGKITQDTYDKETAILKSTLDKQLQAYRDNYAKIDAARSQWQNGMTAALQDYSYEAGDIAGQTYGLVMDGLHGLEDGFAELATKGKFSFRDLADSVIADLARIAAKTLIVQPLIAALFGGGGGANSSGGIGGLVGSLFGGSGSGSQSTGGLWSSLASMGRNVYQLYSAFTGVGSSVAAGYASGGLSGAVQGGYGYYADLFGNLSTTISSGFSGLTSTIGSWFGASSAQAASTAAGQVGYGLGGQLVSGEIGSAGYASAGSSSMSVLWPLAILMGMYQSGKLYDAGVRPDASKMWDSYSEQGNTGKVFGIPQTAGAKWLDIQDNIVGKVVGGKIAAMLSGSTLFQAVWSSVGTKLFGSGWQTKDAGIQLGVTNGDLAAYQYQDQKKKGGLISGSSKKRTQLTPLDDQMQEQVQDAFDARLDTVFSIFDTLNVDVPESALDGLNMDAWKISLKDLTSDQVNQLFSDFFEVLGNEAVGAISKAMNLDLDTYNVNQLTEFVSNLYSINDTFKLLNINALPVSVWGGKLAEQYVAMAGGLEALNTATQTYYDAFFSDAEKNADTLEAVKKQFADLNIAFPSSKEGFRALVEGIDSTTDAGREMFIKLMGLAGNASTAYDILTQQAQAVSQSLLDGAGAAFSALQRSINAQKTSLNDLLSTANQSVTDLTSVGNDLSSALKALRGNSADAVTMLRSQAQATLQNALVTARAGGSLANFPGLSDALDVVAEKNTDMYATFEDFARDQGRSAALIDELNTLNGKQLTNAEKTVKSLQDQLTRLDEQLAFAQSQLDALNNVDNSIMDVTKAVNAMNAAVVAALAGGRGTTDSNSAILQAYQATYGSSYTPDAAGFQYWQNQIASGALTTAQLAEAIRNAAAANGTLPKFAKGTNNWDGSPALVGEFGPEIVTANNLGGNTIYPAQRSRSLLNAGAGDDEAERATETWREKLMKKLNEMARNLALLDKWDADGMPKVRA